MIIRGKERVFELNVQSFAAIEELCPEKDFANFSKISEGKTQCETIQDNLKFACIMNKGYEDHRAFDDPNYQPDYLTMEDMQFLTAPQIVQLQTELTTAIATGTSITVEAEEPKPVGKKK